MEAGEAAATVGAVWTAGVSCPSVAVCYLLTAGVTIRTAAYAVTCVYACFAALTA